MIYIGGRKFFETKDIRDSTDIFLEVTHKFKHAEIDRLIISTLTVLFATGSIEAPS